MRRSAWIDKRATVPPSCRIGERVKIKGNVWLGENVLINDDAIIWGNITEGVFICDDVRIYPKVIIDTGTHEADDQDFINPIYKKIWIGQKAIIDSGAIICKGSMIGAGAIVKQGAVVQNYVPTGTTVAGNPA
ncbi:MAG: hypothetical protein KAU95_02650, partial [Candidatus Aenigmarchaeota archaeon]|nr:hypothetical protein [Candidatus Aenigmarchaeota archaeon]